MTLVISKERKRELVLSGRVDAMAVAPEPTPAPPPDRMLELLGSVDALRQEVKAIKPTDVGALATQLQRAVDLLGELAKQVAKNDWTKARATVNRNGHGQMETIDFVKVNR